MYFLKIQTLNCIDIDNVPEHIKCLKVGKKCNYQMCSEFINLTITLIVVELTDL